MLRNVAALVVVPLFLLPALARAETYYVATAGSDTAAGTDAAPWATLQHAADTVAAGDTVIVHPGAYRGFDLRTGGTAAAPVTFSAEPGVTIDRDNPSTPDGINVENVSHVVIEGFVVVGRTRTGIRAAVCDHVTIRRNRCDMNGRWGVLTGFCDDLLIEDNETSRSGAEHGIYVGNSGDRPHIRANRIWGNNANGIHMNGDASLGGDGIISDGVVEQNVIWDNGTAGGSGINCDGTRTTLIRNNLIYDTHASGISLYAGDGAASGDNIVVNNTVVMASDGRWALNVQSGSTNNRAFNNVLLSNHAFRGAIDVSPDSLPLTSDYNVVIDRFSTDGSAVIDLAAWRTATGQDAHSVVATIAATFLAPASSDYHLAAASPAIDTGTAMDAPSSDLEGRARPVGAAIDIGAFEACPDPCTAPVPDGGVAPATDAGVVPGTDGGVAPGADGGVAPGTDGGVAPRVDGGSTGRDGGAPAPAPGDDGGCGCIVAGSRGASSGSSGLVVLLLAVVALAINGTRPRRRTHRPRTGYRRARTCRADSRSQSRRTSRPRRNR